MLYTPCIAADSTSAVCENGTFVGVLSADNVITWLGVPYAKPPVGSLRWKAPEAPEASTDTFDADTFSAMPIQVKGEARATGMMPQDEDCLYLNVWKASDDTVATSRPVMVWIHGGSFRYNGTGEPEWTGHNLVADNPDIIVVSVGYRLGLMGFIDFSEIPGGSEFAESGNLGLLDVLQSLKWLKANIENFGGDPNNITVFGQSSGSALISLLMTMPEAKGLFQRAILQSGSVSMSMPRKTQTENATQLAKSLLELTGKSDMAGLLEVSSMDLQEASAKLDGALNFPERDGVVLSEDVYAAFATNAGNYDVLIGSDADEVRYFLGAVRSLDVFSTYLETAYETIKASVSSVPAMVSAMDNFIALQGDTESVWAQAEFLNDLLFRGPAIKMASSHTGKTYMYYWNIPVYSAVSDYFGANIGACHGSELPYVLNHHGSLVPEAVLNSTQGQAVRTLVQGMWVDFAKDGELDAHNMYTTAERTTIVISSDATVISEMNDPLSQKRELITPLLQLGISGRDIINAMSATGSPESEPESKPGAEPETPVKSNDIKPETPETETESKDLGVTSGDVINSGSGAGCDAGMFSLMFLVLTIPVAIKKNRL